MKQGDVPGNIRAKPQVVRINRPSSSSIFTTEPQKTPEKPANENSNTAEAPAAPPTPPVAPVAPPPPALAKTAKDATRKDSKGSVPDSLLAAIRSSSQESLRKVEVAEIKDASTPAFLRQKSGSNSDVAASMVKAMQAIDPPAQTDLTSELKRVLSNNRVAQGHINSDDDEW
jgi:hypothetical protein